MAVSTHMPLSVGSGPRTLRPGEGASDFTVKGPAATLSKGKRPQMKVSVGLLGSAEH